MISWRPKFINMMSLKSEFDVKTDEDFIEIPYKQLPSYKAKPCEETCVPEENPTFTKFREEHERLMKGGLDSVRKQKFGRYSLKLLESHL